MLGRRGFSGFRGLGSKVLGGEGWGFEPGLGFMDFGSEGLISANIVGTCWLYICPPIQNSVSTH